MFWDVRNEKEEDGERAIEASKRKKPDDYTGGQCTGSVRQMEKREVQAESTWRLEAGWRDLQGTSPIITPSIAPYCTYC